MEEKNTQFFHLLAGNEEPHEYDEFETEEEPYTPPEHKPTEPHKYYSSSDE